MKAGKILVMRFSALGDVAMTIPVLYSACLANPDREFVMLTKKFPASMFLNPPANLKTIGVDTNEWSGVGGLLRLGEKLWKENDGFSGVVDLHDVLRTKVLRTCFRFKGAEIGIIDKGRRYKKRLVSGDDGMLRFMKPTVERYRLAFNKIGIHFPIAFSGLFQPGESVSGFYAPVAAPKAPGERWIGVAPFAAHAGKVYPPELTLEVVRRLAEEPSAKVFLFGAGPEEEKIFDLWKKEIPELVKVSEGKSGIKGELALMSDCDAMLTMDSANMHLASLVGTRVVSVWGATSPALGFFGWGQRLKDAVSAEMDCRPCSVYGNRPCRKGDYPCLRQIPPEKITELLLHEKTG